MPRILQIFLLFLLAHSLGCSPARLQTEADWTGSTDFDPPYETTPAYTKQQLGGWGGNSGDHSPRRNGQKLEHFFVFVHGNSKNAAAMSGYRDYFHSRGYNDSALWALSWCGDRSDSWREILTGDNSADLQVFLGAVASYTGAAEARIVAHSQGGILVKDLLYRHQAQGVTVTRLTLIASPNGDKTSPTDAGAAACLFSYNRSAPFCKHEFGESEAAVAFRDARVIADPRVERVQVIYSGGTSDDRYHQRNNLGKLADVRFSPRDNVVAPGWEGKLTLSQHDGQNHTELKDRNLSEVFGYMED